MADSIRKNWIDAAKGYGMILVIIAHISEYSPIGMTIYSFHMPLFFFISGYLFSARKDFREFAIGKVKRMVAPYLIYGVLLILWDALVLQGGNYWQYAPLFDGTKLLSTDSYQGTFDWSTTPVQSTVTVLLRDILGMVIQKRMWTIWFLACLMLLVFIFYFLIKIIKKEWIRATVVLILASGGFVFYLIGGKPLPWNIDAGLIAGSFFYAGYLIRKYDLIEKMINRQIRIYILPVAVALNITFSQLNIRIAGYGLDMYNCDYGIIPIMYVAAFMGIASVIILSSLFSIGYIRWIGRYSMFFFIFHQQVCIPLFEGFLSERVILQGEGITEWVRVSVVLILTCLMLSGAVYVLRKTPMKALL